MSTKSRKKSGEIPKIIDTSVIIDGRIADIIRTGFLEGPIVIPEFVLVELRHIADSSDSLKRTRGRRGLDILKKIQTDYGVEIYNTDGEKSLKEIAEVDVKLLGVRGDEDGFDKSRIAVYGLSIKDAAIKKKSLVLLV